MSVFSIVLGGFGLAGVKPVIYRKLSSLPMQAGAAHEYPAQEESRAVLLGHGALDAAPMSALGTPVFCDVAILREGQDVLLLDTVLIDVSMQKNIVTTAVQGRNGTVKEFVSDGDYQVKIRGALVGKKDYPKTEVRDLHEVLKKSELITMVSDYLQLFDIKELVVTDYSFSQQEGYQNVQLFEISAISDDSQYSLILNDV